MLRRILLLSTLSWLLLAVAPSLRAQDQAAKPDTDWLGKVAPGFSLPGIDGKKVDVAKVLGKQPVVLVFYRAFW